MLQTTGCHAMLVSPCYAMPVTLIATLPPSCHATCSNIAFEEWLLLMLFDAAYFTP